MIQDSESKHTGRNASDTCQGGVRQIRVDPLIDKSGDIDDKDVTPALLTYADLLATGDQRNIETAKIIYDQYLAQFIAEDR